MVLINAKKWNSILSKYKEDVNEKYLRMFFETMYERQLIWKRRFIDKREQPWTDNPYFQTIKFTNVYRELDRGCQWEIKNIICDDELSLKDLIWKMLVYRIYNKPEFFSYNMKKFRNGIPSWSEFNIDVWDKLTEDYRSTGDTPFTSSYTVYNKPGYTRDEGYNHFILPTIHKNIDNIINLVKNATSPQEIINGLQIEGSTIGDFISYEIYVDFTYIAKYTNRQFMKFSIDDFVRIGPGSSFGVRLIYNNNYKKNEQVEQIYKLRDIASQWLTKISEEHGEKFPYVYWDKENKKYIISDKCNININQIEMWLCEFSKYWRIVEMNTRPRTKFVLHTKDLIVGS